MNKYVVTVCVVLTAGIGWVALLHYFLPTPAEHAARLAAKWVEDCAQHRPLVECDRDLATLKARK